MPRKPTAPCLCELFLDCVLLANFLSSRSVSTVALRRGAVLPMRDIRPGNTTPTPFGRHKRAHQTVDLGRATSATPTQCAKPTPHSPPSRAHARPCPWQGFWQEEGRTCCTSAASASACELSLPKHQRGPRGRARGRGRTRAAARLLGRAAGSGSGGAPGNGHDGHHGTTPQHSHTTPQPGSRAPVPHPRTPRTPIRSAPALSAHRAPGLKHGRLHGRQHDRQLALLRRWSLHA